MRARFTREENVRRNRWRSDNTDNTMYRGEGVAASQQPVEHSNDLSRPFRGKRMLPASEDATEAFLVEHVKKCRVSSTPGELRLKRDLVDCDMLLTKGVARFDKTAGNPLHMSLTFLCPIVGVGMGNAGTLDSATGGGGAAASGVTLSTTAMRARVPTTFSVLVPKFYPHEPPMLYTDRRFSRTCSFVREDGLLQLPFLAIERWSSVTTMLLVVQSLLEGLQRYAAGHLNPWGIFPQHGGHGEQDNHQHQHRPVADSPTEHQRPLSYSAADSGQASAELVASEQQAAEVGYSGNCSNRDSSIGWGGGQAPAAAAGGWRAVAVHSGCGGGAVMGDRGSGSSNAVIMDGADDASGSAEAYVVEAGKSECCSMEIGGS